MGFAGSFFLLKKLALRHIFCKYVPGLSLSFEFVSRFVSWGAILGVKGFGFGFFTEAKFTEHKINLFSN